MNLARMSIQDSRVCCTFQLSLVYNRVCWVSVDAASGFLVLKNEPRALSDFSGHFSGSREGGPAGFCVVLGSGELGEGRLG